MGYIINTCRKTNPSTSIGILQEDEELRAVAGGLIGLVLRPQGERVYLLADSSQATLRNGIQGSGKEVERREEQMR